ncbi:MAG: LolA family protein [Candidatus Saccharimonadaceae bacterium]
MNTIRTLVLTLSALLLITGVKAQNSADSKALLDKASQLYEKSEGIKLSFKLEILESDGSAYEPQNGTAMVKGNKFKLDLPFATTWFDGTTQWVLLKDANEVNISNPTVQELVSISPLALLNIYKTGYKLSKPINRTLNGKDVVEIEMMPTDKKQEFKTLNISIDKKTNVVAQVNFTTKNGSKNKLTISEYNSNNNFTNDLFTFNKHNHPGVEVIDLR